MGGNRHLDLSAPVSILSVGRRMSITLGILEPFVMFIDGALCLLMVGFTAYAAFFVMED